MNATISFRMCANNWKSKYYIVLFTGDENDDGSAKTISSYEKAVLRNEFIEIMKQRFLDGKDSEFNYR